MAISLIGTLFASAAPELARRGFDLLSGIFRGAGKECAEKVSELIKEKTGIDINDVAESKLTEDQWVRLKQFELDHQEVLLGFCREIDAHERQMEGLRIEDRKNARIAQEARDQVNDKFISRFSYYYAYMITVLTFVFIFFAIFGPMLFETELPDNSWRIIDTVLGFLLGIGLSAIIQFFYGSSQGSKNKSEQLDKITGQFYGNSNPNNQPDHGGRLI